MMNMTTTLTYMLRIITFDVNRFEYGSYKHILI